MGYFEAGRCIYDKNTKRRQKHGYNGIYVLRSQSASQARKNGCVFSVAFVLAFVCCVCVFYGVLGSGRRTLVRRLLARM